MFSLDDSIEAGFAELDAEHKVQVGLVAALCQALAQGQDQAAVDEILDRLVSYTDAHFMAEQLLMRLYNYPHYEAHVQEHDRLVEQVTALQKQYRAGEIDASLTVGDALKDWLLMHIKGSDQALGDYLSRHGVTA